MRGLDAWCHFPQLILKAGRCTHPDPDWIKDEEEKNAYIEKLNTDDPTIERFKGLNEDK